MPASSWDFEDPNPSTGAIDWQPSAKCATTATVANLSSVPVVNFAGSGVTVAENVRVLVKNTASPDGIIAAHAKYNGPYIVGVVVGGNAPLTRAPDFDTDAEVSPGAAITVESGNAAEKGIWILGGVPPLAIGVDALVFARDSLLISGVLPQALGVAAPGASGLASDAAHVHVMPSATDVGSYAQATIDAKDAAAIATAEAYTYPQATIDSKDAAVTSAAATDATTKANAAVATAEAYTYPQATIDSKDAAVAATAAAATATAQATANAALPKAGGQMSGNITMAGAETVDGRDLSVDGTALDALPASISLKAPNSRQIISGAGLTGGGDLSADRTLAVGAGTGITVNADDVALANTAVTAGSYTNSSLTVDAQGRLTAASSGAAPAPATRAINTTDPITGGGDLSADRTIAVSTDTATNTGAGSSGKLLKLDANGKAAGRVLETDGAKLDGIASGATNNPYMWRTYEVPTIGITTSEKGPGGAGVDQDWGVSTWSSTVASNDRVYIETTTVIQLIVELSAAITIADTLTLKYYVGTVPGASPTYGVSATTIGTMVNADGVTKTFNFTPGVAGMFMITGIMSVASIVPTSRFRWRPTTY